MKPTATMTTSLFRNAFGKKMQYLTSTIKIIPKTTMGKSAQFRFVNQQLRSLSNCYLTTKQSYLFSEEKKGPLKSEDIPAENLQVVET